MTTRFLSMLLLAFFIIPSTAFAQQEASDAAAIHWMVVDANPEDTTIISRHLYGHFAEHLGRDIYGGFWIKGESGEWYLNQDVIEALRAIGIPNLRWPGGCFADTYHWKTGIGPREERPPNVNIFWGGVVEDNSFGIHEYMKLVEALGAEPVIVGNVGSGTVREMAQWTQYLTGSTETALGQLRAKNGHSEPWQIKYWGVGNESWGCGGNMDASYYADLYKRYATYLRDYGEGELYLIAAGPSGDNYHWTETLMREADHLIDGIDLHYYTVVGTWADKGSAVDFGEEEWFIALKKALYIDELITRHTAIMNRYDPEGRVDLIVGEWGLWHEAKPGTKPAFLYQQNTLRDALVAAVTLDIFNRHAERVKMANIAQTVNVLQAMILTKGDEMVLTPTYHVFDLYQVHHNARLLPTTLERGEYTFADETIPALSSSISRGENGRIHITLTNLGPHRSRTVKVEIRGQEVTEVSGRILTAGAMNAHNTFEAPEVVVPEAFEGARLEGQTLTVELPPKSVIALELE